MPSREETEYKKFSTVKFSGEASDVGPDALPVGALLESHNMRHEGQSPHLVTRTGYRRFAYIASKTEGSQHFGDGGPVHGLAKCEYVYWHPNADGSGQTEFRADVTLSWLEGDQKVRVLLLDKRSAEGTGTGWTQITTKSGVAAKPSGCIMQYGPYLVISLFDAEGYIIWPKAVTEDTTVPRSISIGGDESWNVEVLGKDVCPMPKAYDFPVTLTGDLIVFSAHADDHHAMQYDTVSQTDPAPVELRLPIEATYTRAGGAAGAFVFSNADEQAIVTTNLIPRFRFAKKDHGPNVGTDGAGGISHFMHRGYFYRFVFVRTLTLPDGTKVKLRSNPSSDLFVPALVYAPFFWFDPLSDNTHKGFPQSINDNQTVGWRQAAPVFNSVDVPSPIPNLSAMTVLQALYRAYFKDGTDAGASAGTGGPLHWVSHWLGWCSQSDFVVWGGQPPYKCDPTAEDITGAPQTIFDWADFGITGADVKEIEVYRTAYEHVDPEVRATKTPNFKPHVYGLVGSIEKGGTFTDTTKIPDFGIDPSAFGGYQRGQFSGDISFQYGQSPAIVFGNVRTDYSLLTPTPLVQAFVTGEAGTYGGGYPAGVIFSTVARDNDSMLRFYYAYEDRDGYLSAAVPIGDIKGSVLALGSGQSVGFTFPFGYAPSIKKILLFRSQFRDTVAWINASGAPGQDPNGTREIVQIAAIEPEPGTYVSSGAEVGTAPPASYPAGDYVKFYEPGEIIYSKPDQPWDWPAGYAEKHGSSPVRRLMDTMGELAIEGEDYYNLTLLRTANPRSERETQFVGVLSKNAGAKVEDVDIVLSAHGLYILTPSRAEALQHPVENELASYLAERIPDGKGGFYPPLANVRRASIGYLDTLRELWLHIPSSVDLWPKLPDDTGALTVPNPAALPQRTFVFHFGPTIRDIEAYSFDLTTEFEIKMKTSPTPGAPPVLDRSTFNPSPVLFYPGSDGGLWASYTDPRPGFNGALVSIDCHYAQSDYTGYGSATIALGLGEIEGQKQIERTFLKMKARGQIQIVTGPPKQTEGEQGDPVSGWDPLRGHISDSAEIFDVLRVRKNTARVYEHAGIDRALDTKGSAIMVRVRTTPDEDSSHRVEIRGITVKYDQKQQGA